jgi:methyl-accepting chemotaxis protein
VNTGSRQVSDSSIALSQGATQQASAIEQLTCSIEEIAAKTKHNANNANKAKEISGMVKDSGEKGNAQMKEMLKAMDEIKVSSNNISKIIKVIDDIAFQTNILALNAAVEAARAGQQGKGFAVVAEEVRNLASRSANAAKETAILIESSIKKVEDGIKITNLNAESLSNIVEGVTKVTQLVIDIASSSDEQAIGVDEINKGITQIADVVQTTSATSEETAAASEELSGQAQMLKQQVETFKLKSMGRANQVNIQGTEQLNIEDLKILENKRYKIISLSDEELTKY